MINLHNHLENLESDELVYKLKNNYFQNEACELAKQILIKRGVQIPEILENTENSKLVFLSWEWRGLSPSIHFHVSLGELYSPRNQICVPKEAYIPRVTTS
jgi:hypothetical protein